MTRLNVTDLDGAGNIVDEWQATAHEDAHLIELNFKALYWCENRKYFYCLTLLAWAILKASGEEPALREMHRLAHKWENYD